MINKAQLLGRIGKKDTKTTRNGTDMTILSIATGRKYIDSQGQKQEKTTWHNVQCFSKLAEIAQKYAHVGHLIYIEGEINNQKVVYENVEKWMYSVTASEIKLLPQPAKKKDNDAQPNQSENQNSWDDGLDDSSIPF